MTTLPYRGKPARTLTTIYDALANKLGRVPTNSELRADVERIKAEALRELADATAKVRDRN